MNGILRRHFLKFSAAAGAAAIMAPALVGRAVAQTKSLTVASLLGDDKPETKIWLRIGEIVEAKLPGQFSFNIVRNGALGGEKEVAEGVRLGSVQASLATVSSLSGWVPEAQILDLPFLYNDAAHVARVVNGDTGEELKKKFEEQSFIVGGYINYGARHLLAKEPVSRPDQMQGKRIRVIQSPLHTKLWSAFGANPIGIPITETYNALQTGVADAMDLTKSAYAGFKLYEVVPYLTETGHIWASGVVYYSSALWASLTDEQKAVFREASREGAAYFNQLIVEDETASMKIAEQHGGKIIKPENFGVWQQGAQGVWEDFAPVVGGLKKIKAVQTV